MSEMGYKYWVAFEVRCLETDKRMYQNHTIFLSKQVESEDDIEVIQDEFADNIEQHGKERNTNASFQVRLTCWPHFLGMMEKPKKKKPTVKAEPKKPSLYLAVNNVNVDEIIH